jgi:magnesium transporter
MIRVLSFENGTVRTAEGATAVPDAPGPEERFWVHVAEPDAEEAIALVLGLGIHELALEDARNEGHPPKLEDFGTHLFLIAHTPLPGGDLETHKVSMFLSRGWIVTVEREARGILDPVAERVRRDPGRYLRAPERLAHAILDHLTEGFETLSDGLMDRTEDLEDQACTDPPRDTLAGILALRRGVTALVRTVRDQRDVAQALVRTADERLAPESLPYFRDIQDHLHRVHAQLDGVLHGLAAAREAYQSSVNNNLSDTMRLLTVLTFVFMPLHFVAGFFGMNFDDIPGLHSPVAFWSTVVVMLALAASMLLWFRRRGWL